VRTIASLADAREQLHLVRGNRPLVRVADEQRSERCDRAGEWHHQGSPHASMLEDRLERRPCQPRVGDGDIEWLARAQDVLEPRDIVFGHGLGFQSRRGAQRSVDHEAHGRAVGLQ
jgi:hypothetical protein